MCCDGRGRVLMGHLNKAFLYDYHVPATLLQLLPRLHQSEHETIDKAPEIRQN